MSSSGRYIVVFKDHVSKDDVQKYVNQVNNEGGQVTNVYDSVLNGFAAHIPDQTLQGFQSLVGDGIIDYIEPDGVVTTQ